MEEKFERKMGGIKDGNFRGRSQRKINVREVSWWGKKFQKEKNEQENKLKERYIIDFW